MKARAKSVEDMIAIDRNNVVLTALRLPEAVVREDFSSNAFEFFEFRPSLAERFLRREPTAIQKSNPWQY
jgi:hypothetical protein